MATIKDVARLAGVSVTTVSIVLNGKAEDRKISVSTQERIRDAMRQLGYQPNLTARRLRFQESKKPVIAFFWPLDYRTMILASFLNALQLEIKRINFDCELVIQTYENDKLDQYDASILKTGYSAIIIGACSKKDMEYLEQLSPHMPLVLINRYSEQFSTVCTDTKMIGFMAAQQIRQRGYTEAVVFASENSYLATTLRTQAFLESCSQMGIQVDPDHILRSPSTIDGGALAVEQYCQIDNPPKIIFSDSDSIAIGALRAFYKRGIRIPEDIEILSVAVMAKELTANSIPSLSVIEMPTLEIGRRIIHLLRDKISNNNLEPTHINLDVTLVLRESFRGISS